MTRLLAFRQLFIVGVSFVLGLSLSKIINGTNLPLLCREDVAFPIYSIVDSNENDHQKIIAELSSDVDLGIKEKRRKSFDLTAQLHAPPVVTSKLDSDFDTCRNELTSTITLSQFCVPFATENVDKMMPAQFDLIEQELSSFASLFDEKKDNFRVVTFPNALCQQDERVNPSDITLTTHMSVNKVQRFVALAARWNGPISVAVHITSMEDLRQFKSFLFATNLQYLGKVAFHFFFESQHRAYPNNILRNLALDQVKSDYFALFDVDLLPSPMNTHQHLRSAFQKHPHLEDKLKNKTVFVLPAWEIKGEIPDEDVKIQHPLYPETREMAIQMNSEVENQTLTVFHNGCFHGPTNYTKWKSNLKALHYPIKVQEYGYEPYIIGAIKDSKRFFKYFHGYGFDKQSYFVELHYARYSMEVLKDFFIFHINHPSSYGKEKKSNLEVNAVCKKFFCEHLAKEYGAGHLGKGREVPGWNKWMDNSFKM